MSIVGVACRGWVGLARCRDGNPLQYCSVIPTLFGYFLGIPSLYVLSFWTCFCGFLGGRNVVKVVGFDVVVRGT